MEPITFIIVGSAILGSVAAWKMIKGASTPAPANPSALPMPGQQLVPAPTSAPIVSPYQATQAILNNPIAPSAPNIAPPQTASEFHLNTGGGGGVGSGLALAGTGLAVAPAAAAAVGLPLKVGGEFAKSIPFIGAAVAIASLIAGGLLAASAKRAQQARTENAATNSGVAHFDDAVTQIFNALNAGQIGPNDAITLFAPVYQQYWSIVSPQIQPGRNGCKNGSAIPQMQGGGVGHGDKNMYFGCGTKADWGAACCVGSVIKASIANAIWAIQNPGQQATIPKVFASKYGSAAREGYHVLYTPRVVAH